jgi:hypothetical protein
LAQENRDAKSTLLIVTSYSSLLSQLGAPAVDGVFESLGRMVRVKRDAGFDAHVYVPDDADRSTGRFPVIPGELDAQRLREGLAEVECLLRPSGHLDYILIVGDGEVVPFWYLGNPAADSDGEFPTDVPYAAADDGAEGNGPGDAVGDAGDIGGDLGGNSDPAERFLLPDRAVARIPLRAGPGSGLQPYLEALATEARRGAERGRHFGLSALQWKEESAKVYGVLAEGGLMTSPPVDSSSFEAGWLRSRALIYFNVHGSKDEKYWYGQKGLSYPRVLGPEIVASAAPADSVVLSEACYGGLVDGKTPADSMAMRFIDRGVAAFVGSSAIAYGSPDEKLTEADLLAFFFFQRLVAGETCGSALREAKIDFAAEMLDRQGYLDGDDRKTLLEFNLFGDPTVGIYKEGGLADRSGDMVSEEVLAHIKKIASQRFPEMDGIEPAVSEQTGVGAEAVAEKVGKLRPASTAKEVPRPSGRVFVASFRQMVTAEGREIERIVRITFHESGQVIKVVTSK